MPAFFSASCTRTVSALRILTHSSKLLVHERIEKSSELAPKPAKRIVGSGCFAMPSVERVTSISSCSTLAGSVP